MVILASVFAGAYLRAALAVVWQFARRPRHRRRRRAPALGGSDSNAHETSCGCFPSDFGGRKFEAVLFLTVERRNAFVNFELHCFCRVFLGLRYSNVKVNKIKYGLDGRSQGLHWLTAKYP